MAKQIAIGIQSLEKLIKGGYYYIDKTKFIKEWRAQLQNLYMQIRKG